jgi:antitoxin CptB
MDSFRMGRPKPTVPVPSGLYTCALFEERSMVEDVEINRLYWHSRRGMLELDVLLVPFTKEVYATLNKEDRDLYVRLLTCEDQDMFGWFMERAESEDPELQRMVRMILDRVQPK